MAFFNTSCFCDPTFLSYPWAAEAAVQDGSEFIALYHDLVNYDLVNHD